MRPGEHGAGRVGTLRVVGPVAGAPPRSRAAALSIASNAVLIALKAVAGIVTGSIAIISEAVHSSIDLVASLIAFFSVRTAEKPADESHPYGHEKVESLSAVVEGILILVGAAVIVFESVRRVTEAAPVERIGFGIAVVAFSGVANAAVSAYLYRQARATDSPALEGDAAHLRADAATSLAVLVALVAVEVTGIQELDPATALLVAGAIVVAGLRIIGRSSRVLVDEVLPAEELALVRAAIEDAPTPEVIGFHKLRARRAGSRRYVDLHVQFRPGTTLERAHEVAHEVEGEIRRRVRGADVLIHLEPAEAAQPPRGEAEPRGER